MMQEIQKTEESVRTKKTIIIGDMNEMPYAKGCLNANAMHGLPVLDTMDKDTRKVSKTPYSESELYNAGIVDVSYRYDKMYVVRPQCFIPIITLLRNAALNALQYKQELAVVRNQDIDISNFEDNLMKFKNDFSRNYDIAHSHFDKAIEEIDKTIQHLEKVKKELQGSDNQLRIANNKVDEVSVKKLTKDNPTMQAKFERLRRE